MSAQLEADPFADLDTDPRSSAIVDDYRARENLIDDLVKRRKLRKISQAEVAARMGVGQSTISEFENEASDPRLSTLQRYARAVDDEVRVSLQSAVQPLDQWRILAASAPDTRRHPVVRLAKQGVSVPRGLRPRLYVEPNRPESARDVEGLERVGA